MNPFSTQVGAIWSVRSGTASRVFKMDSRIARQWVASAAETVTCDSPKIWSWRSPIFLDLEPGFLAIRQRHLLSPFSTQAGAIWGARSGAGGRVSKMDSRIARQWVASAAETVTSDSPRIWTWRSPIFLDLEPRQKEHIHIHPSNKIPISSRYPFHQTSSLERGTSYGCPSVSI